METSDKYHVVFGAGPLGIAVAKQLKRKGKRVRIVTRSGKAAVSEKVEVLQGDAADIERCKEVCQ